MSICFKAARLEGNTWVDDYPENHPLRNELDVSNHNAFAIMNALDIEPEHSGSACPEETLDKLKALDTTDLRKDVVSDRPDMGTIYVIKLQWVCKQAIRTGGQLTWA